MLGVVKSWKGAYGFIRPDDDTGRDLFVHWREIQGEPGEYRELIPGERVSFDTERAKDTGRVQAVGVRVLAAAEVDADG